jgi:hypothetical protein
MKMIKKCFILVFLLTSFIIILLSETNRSTIQDQWEKSPHANSMNTKDERERMNKTGCAHCHTAQGYWEVILGRKKSTAPYKNATGITCEACHFSEQGDSGQSPLRAGDVQKACTGCHDIMVQNNPEGFSSCPQGSLVKGAGGAEFEGRTYPSSSHANLRKNCAGCHMAKSPQQEKFSLVGEHTFRVISKGEKPEIFNKNGCLECHDQMSLEFLRKSQAKTQKLLKTLARLLPQKLNLNSEKPEENPKFPQDPSMNKMEAMAAYNYYQILKDGTIGVHNPNYINTLLEDSIAVLKTQLTAKKKKEASMAQ